MEIDSHIDRTVAVHFVVTQDEDVYSDVLYFTQDEYDALTEADVRVLEVERFTNWKAVVVAASA